MDGEGGADGADEGGHNIQLLHKAVTELDGFVIGRAVDDGDAHPAAAVTAEELLAHGVQRIGEAAGLDQRLIHAVIVDENHGLDLQQGADHAFHQADPTALAQVFQRTDEEGAQLRLAQPLHPGDHVRDAFTALERLGGLQYQQPQPAGKGAGVHHVDRQGREVVREHSHHVVGAAQPGGHRKMQDARAALRLQLAVQAAHVLRQRQGGLGQFAFEQLINIVLIDFQSVAEFAAAGGNAQGNCADVVDLQLLLAQVAGGIRDQRDQLVTDFEHKRQHLFLRVINKNHSLV